MKELLLFYALVLLFFPIMSMAQAKSAAAVDLISTHGVFLDMVYNRADGMDLKLDIYAPKANFPSNALALSGSKKKAVPTLVYFHGGGWTYGSKDSAVLQLMPFLQKGWAAVAVQYRLVGEALAPAAVEDTRCATWWVKRNANEYGFDPDRIVLSGSSSGGHLALITGMLTADAGLDTSCPGRQEKSHTDDPAAEFPELNVAAIAQK